MRLHSWPMQFGNHFVVKSQIRCKHANRIHKILVLFTPRKKPHLILSSGAIHGHERKKINQHNLTIENVNPSSLLTGDRSNADTAIILKLKCM